jgi:hypothetical protein
VCHLWTSHHKTSDNVSSRNVPIPTIVAGLRWNHPDHPTNPSILVDHYKKESKRVVLSIYSVIDSNDMKFPTTSYFTNLVAVLAFLCPHPLLSTLSSSRKQSCQTTTTFASAYVTTTASGGSRQLRPSLYGESSGTSRTTPPSTRLFGISEWRDVSFDYPGTGNDRRLGKETTGPPKEVCILPFPYDEVLLQGETKQLRLYEDRFIKLFDHCMGRHEGVVGMGLLADSGIIQTIPLCEIEAYNRLEGFGIFVTIRVVGRAQLDEILQQEPYLKAVCRELTDTIPPNLELPNLLASNIENYLLLLSSIEHQLASAPDPPGEGEDTKDAAEMRRRIQIAKLVSSDAGLMHLFRHHAFKKRRTFLTSIAIGC